MKYLLNTIIAFLLLSCLAKQNNLGGKKQTVEFHYIMWACTCANWATAEDIRKYLDKGGLADHCVFVEPADRALSLPDTLCYGDDIVQFTGQYYVDKGYPKDHIQTEEPVDKAKIFRYTAYKIIQSNYRETLADRIDDSSRYKIDKGKLNTKTQTINVSYAAIECTCPQWFETKKAGDTMNDRKYFYLEPADSNLIFADTLYDGTNLPLQLSLTGQFYSKEGYPANYFPAKGSPDPSKVFRYSRLQVTANGNKFFNKKRL